MRDTIDMAREVKMPYDFVTGEPINLEKLKDFEALVRADERAQPAPVQEPVWIQPDHLQKAQTAPFLCRVEPHKRDDFVPLYTTPPAQPAPVQEPVASVPIHPKTGPLWAMTTDKPDPERLPSYPLMSLYTTPPAAQRRIEELEAQLMQMQGRELKLQMALNTPAAQRQWVGLTDEEIDKIVWNLPYEPDKKDIRAIEAKLKEKNT